jgi:hypothetical protein
MILLLFVAAFASQNEKTDDADFVGTHGRKCLDALIMACECHQPRLSETALDTIHYFIGGCFAINSP